MYLFQPIEYSLSNNSEYESACSGTATKVLGNEAYLAEYALQVKFGF